MPADQVAQNGSQITPPGQNIIGLLPSFDGQTTFSIIFGTILSIVLFWIGYKQTVGAREERIKSASNDLIASVLRRVAVERQSIMADQFDDIRSAKSYKYSVPLDRLISFRDALSVVLSETIDNNFLDNASKETIISLLTQSRNDIKVEEPKSYDKDLSKAVVVVLLAVASSGLGGVSAWFTTIKFDGILDENILALHDPKSIMTLALVFITSATILSALVIVAARSKRTGNASSGD